MKTAVILYGFFRTFNFCKHSLVNHVLLPMDADVFFSTPETVYTRKQDEMEFLHHVFCRNEDLVDTNILDSFNQGRDRVKQFSIRKYDSAIYKKFLTDNKFPFYNDFTKQHLWKVLSSLHSFSLSMNLWKKYVETHKVNYDLVILTRPDIRYYTNFNPSAVDMNKINCPKYFAIDPSHDELKHMTPEQQKDIYNRRRFGGAGVHGFNRWLNDNMLVGNQHNMLQLCTLWDNIVPYVHSGVNFNYETLVGAHMIKNNIPFDGSDFIVYELWRPDRFEW